MKKLFTVLVASICGTMAYAQSGAISVNDVTVMKGATTQVEVAINDAANMTAFQFDLAVPAGFTVTDAKLNGEYGESRHLLNGEVGDKVRFLSYDDGNEKLLDGEKVIVTLEATEEAETATLTGDGIVVVDPEGNSVGAEDLASADITVVEGVNITIGATLVSTLVSEKDLDFSKSAVTAYIATGYDYKSNNILLTRVKDVPANTPILLMADNADTYVIPTTTSRIYYPENFLKGKATETATVDWSGKYTNLLLKSGQFRALDPSITEYTAGKCYLQIPASVTPKAGDALSFTMGANGVKSYTGMYDLDFTSVEGLSAYIVTGYDKNNTIWLTRVKKVSANTPLILLGEANTPYEVPSTEQQTSYVNMLRGDAENAITITPTADGWTNLILLKGSYKGLPVESYDVPAGSSYLPIPSSILAASRGEFAMGLNMEEAEVITMKAIYGGEDDDATGISRIASESGNDTWYNLKGQRIDKPTKKGLYIKNGMKVIVK
jgi:hypothetical protein